MMPQDRCALQIIERVCILLRAVKLCCAVCTADENYVENCVMCLTDSPDVHVVSLPHLRPQIKVDAVHLVGRLDTPVHS